MISSSYDDEQMRSCYQTHNNTNQCSRILLLWPLMFLLLPLLTFHFQEPPPPPSPRQQQFEMFHYHDEELWQSTNTSTSINTNDDYYDVSSNFTSNSPRSGGKADHDKLEFEDFLREHSSCRGGKVEIVIALIKAGMNLMNISDDDCDGFPNSWHEATSIYGAGIERFVSSYVVAKQLASNFHSCQGKERVIAIFIRAGILMANNNETAMATEADEYCKTVPTWKQVTSLYGSEPVVYGLETCEEYRRRRSVIDNNNNNNTEPSQSHAPRVGVAGLFNTGTNALAQSFNLNLKRYDGADNNTNNNTNNNNNNSYKRYYIPGGKHVPPTKQWYETFNWEERFEESRRKVLPIVLIRDPYRWMQSMCKAPYNAEWERPLGSSCPNLVRTSEQNNETTYKIRVRLHGNNHFDNYESLADLWSKWNKLYYDSLTSYPLLMIRFEDTLFHPEKVWYLISRCAGYELGPNHHYQYNTEASKKSKGCSNYAEAIIKYGKPDGRNDGLRPLDKQYLQSGEALDPDLMRTFHYKH